MKGKKIHVLKTKGAGKLKFAENQQLGNQTFSALMDFQGYRK